MAASDKPAPVHSHVDFELADGTIVPLMLTWRSLNTLRNRDRELYSEYSRLVGGGELSTDDLMGMARITYVAYVCASLDGGAGKWMEWEDFLDALPDSPLAVGNAVTELIAPKD